MADTPTAARPATLLQRAVQRWQRLLGNAVHEGPRARRHRARALAFGLSLAYVLFGSLQFANRPELLQKSPFDLDLALRALALGWFDDARTWPVTLVDIDEATHRGWGSPAATPRVELARILEQVTGAGPRAVLVDIDLSGELTPAGAQQEAPLLDFLRSYRGPAPLVFPKRLQPRGDGAWLATTSLYDELVSANPNLSWSHANLITDTHGTVRAYSDWELVCGPGPAEWLPFAPLAFARLLADSDAGTPQDAASACRSGHPAELRQHRLLVGPRLSAVGEQAINLQGTAFTVRAAALLDTRPLDPGLFSDRIVLVGATHLASSDHWLTPAGVLPGVELLAQTVRFWPLQPHAAGGQAALGVRIGAVLLFAVFALLDWYLRPLFALLAAGLFALLLAAVAINGFGGYAVFDVIEAAVLLAVLYKLLRLSWEFVAGFLASRRARRPDGRVRGTLKALVLRDELGEVEDD
jgi:hypothetical protein